MTKTPDHCDLVHFVSTPVFPIIICYDLDNYRQVFPFRSHIQETLRASLDYRGMPRCYTSPAKEGFITPFVLSQYSQPRTDWTLAPCLFPGVTLIYFRKRIHWQHWNISEPFIQAWLSETLFERCVYYSYTVGAAPTSWLLLFLDVNTGGNNDRTTSIPAAPV